VASSMFAIFNNIGDARQSFPTARDWLPSPPIHALGPLVVSQRLKITLAPAWLTNALEMKLALAPGCRSFHHRGAGVPQDTALV
jgi:hypothetical protein